MKYRFLILEDDAVARKFLELILVTAFKKSHVTSLSGIDQIHEQVGKPEKLGDHYDVIFTDIFLSGDRTGVDLLRELPPKTQQRTIVCSTVDQEKFQALCREHKFACRFVRKPVDAEQVLKEVQKILGSSSRTPVDFLPTASTVQSLPEQPVIMVTGCSSGIGASIARQLIEIPNYRIVLTARQNSLDRVKEMFTENDRLMILPLDLRDSHQATQTFISILLRWGRIDVLINNAGICYRSVVEQMDLDSELDQLKVNYLGPMTLIRHAIPVMREQGRGKIINVSSVSGILGMPTMASYSASKHALEGASESLWHELKPMGINVSVVRPGFVNSDAHTHIFTTHKAQLAEMLSGPYADFYKFMRPFVAKLMGISLGTPDSIAKKVIAIIQTQNPPLWVNVTPAARIITKYFAGKVVSQIYLFLAQLTSFFG